MNIHEYQAKEIFRAHGIPVPPGEVAETPEKARALALQFGGRVVVKAQVHAGGRGKAGGVKLANDADQARDAASQILGMKIKELIVQRVLVTPASEIATEAYAGVILDRVSRRPVFIVSPAGGIDIEEVAEKTPEKLLRVGVDPRYGLLAFQAMRMGYFLFQDPRLASAAARIMSRLYEAFMGSGASLAEINPLVSTHAGELLALDAKMTIDDNELDRRADLEALRDESAEAESEVEARAAGLTFIKLDGDVGCVVNGAGLAMATMDLVKYYGGEPANFLDIGGSSSPEKVISALQIISRDANVRAILFNIFGGITRTDDVANGIVAAAAASPLHVPIVIRLTGTNEELAVNILQEHGFAAMTDMDDAVKRAVALATGAAA